MLSAAVRLRGTGRAELPESMVKFEGFGDYLRVVSFSKIRPTTLNLNAVLRLESRGIDRSILERAQRKWSQMGFDSSDTSYLLDAPSSVVESCPVRRQAALGDLG